MRNDDFDVDEYIKQCEEENKKIFEEAQMLKIDETKIAKLSEEDQKLADLEKQILEEREKEDKFIETLSEQKRKEYLHEKYKLIDQLADLNKAKKVDLKAPNGKKE